MAEFVTLKVQIPVTDGTLHGPVKERVQAAIRALGNAAGEQSTEAGQSDLVAEEVFYAAAHVVRFVSEKRKSAAAGRVKT